MVGYKEKAKKARLKVLDMLYKAQTSHIGSNFSVIDIMTVLFEHVDLKKDKIILSAGWKAAAFYYFLAEKGLITKKELDTYCQENSRLIGLTEPGIPGVLFAGGSMQMGLPAAVGFALSKRMKGEEGNVYCIMSDGELAGGTTWESVLIASHYRLGNLTVFVDNNELQAMGKIDDILGTGFPQKNWNIHAIDGHDHDMIERAVNTSKKDRFSPLCFISKTIKGKGVSEFEGNNDWHYRNIPKDIYLKAKQELYAG